jgi:hypothetical protein
MSLATFTLTLAFEHIADLSKLARFAVLWYLKSGRSCYAAYRKAIEET